MGEVLEAYWGPEYGRVRAAALEAGIDLTEDVQAPPPWSEVQDQAREHFSLTADNEASLRRLFLNEDARLTEREWLEKNLSLRGKVLDDIALGELAAIRGRYEPDIEASFLHYFAELDAAVYDQWATQSFEKGPLFLPKGEKVPMVKASAFQVNGWAVSWVARSDEYPQLVELSSGLQELVWNRDREMQAYVDGM